MHVFRIILVYHAYLEISLLITEIIVYAMTTGIGEMLIYTRRHIDGLPNVDGIVLHVVQDIATAKRMLVRLPDFTRTAGHVPSN